MDKQQTAPKVTGSPDAIWLVYGELDDDATHAECYTYGDVTWCDAAQYPADVEYVRADLVAQRVQDAVAAQALDAVKLRGDIAMLRATMESAAYQLTKARIWNGMGWSYNVLHPLHYKPALDRLREVLDGSACSASIAPLQAIEQTNSTSQHQAETMRAQLQGRT